MRMAQCGHMFTPGLPSLTDEKGSRRHYPALAREEVQTSLQLT
jgi:hypothetical protein